MKKINTSQAVVLTTATRIGLSRLLPAIAVAIIGVTCATADEVKLKSPNSKVSITIKPGAHLTYSVTFRGERVVEPSQIGLIVDGDNLGQNANLNGKPARSVLNETYPTRGVHTQAVNHCNLALIPLEGGPAKTPWQLEVRAYNDGVAYRYIVPGEGVRHINAESTEWTIPIGTVLWRQNEENRSYEARYYPDIVGQLPKGMRCTLPSALEFPDGVGYGLITEANLVDYTDMCVELVGQNRFRAFLHDDQQGWDHTGPIVTPWRVTLLAADLDTLVNSDLVRNLCPAPSPELQNAEWIKPGRSIWHWLTGGAPKIEEQKAWIDGTRRMGYEYYLVDDGWRDWDGGGENAWKALEEMVAYAKTQEVAIWAWVHCKYVFEPADRFAYFKRAKDIGIVGLKIDFPNPANAVWVKWYDDTLRDAAAARLMVNFHGAVKPTGRERTWPHEMTREAVSGREQGKNPSLHDTTLPFLRYVQGHADYTPTLFIPKRLNGSSLAHELAMAITYTSPYLCMGDNPTNYLNSQAVDVLKELPPVWDKTVVLPLSRIGQVAGLARLQGDQWFIGVINDTMPRREQISLQFLGKGAYKVVELADHPDRNDAFVRSELQVTRKDTLILPLRRDGGYVAWLVPVE